MTRNRCCYVVTIFLLFSTTVLSQNLYYLRGEQKSGQCVICGVGMSWWEGESGEISMILLDGTGTPNTGGRPTTWEENIFCGSCATVYVPWLKNIVAKYINGWQADSLKSRKRYDDARKVAAKEAIKRKIQDAEDELSFLKTGKRPHAERREKKEKP